MQTNSTGANVLSQEFDPEVETQESNNAIANQQRFDGPICSSVHSLHPTSSYCLECGKCLLTIH